MRWPLSGLWTNSDFVKLWVGQTVSELGSQIGGTALPLVAVLTLAATPAQLGVLSALGAVPVLLLGPFIGVWVDRLRRRPLMIAADAGRALILATIPLAALWGHVQLGQLYVVAILVSLLTMIFEVANGAHFPTLIPGAQLIEGNSKIAASENIAEVGGPAVGGMLVQVLTAPFAVGLDALSFVVSAVGIALIQAPEPTAHLNPTDGDILPQHSLWREAIGGIQVALGHPLLRGLIAYTATSNFFGMFFGVLYTVYVIRDLGLSPLELGILVGMGGVGAIIGTTIAERTTRRFGVGPTLISTALLAGAMQSLNLLAGSGHLMAFLLLATVQCSGDILWSIFFVNEVSLRQSIVPTHLLGRVNACQHLLTRGFGPLGALLAGELASNIGTRSTLLIAVVGMVLAVTWLFWSPLRTTHERPEPERPEAIGASSSNS